MIALCVFLLLLFFVAPLAAIFLFIFCGFKLFHRPLHLCGLYFLLALVGRELASFGESLEPSL